MTMPIEKLLRAQGRDSLWHQHTCGAVHVQRQHAMLEGEAQPGLERCSCRRPRWLCLRALGRGRRANRSFTSEGQPWATTTSFGTFAFSSIERFAFNFAATVSAAAEAAGTAAMHMACPPLC